MSLSPVSGNDARSPVHEIWSWHVSLLFLAAAVTLFSRFFQADTFGFFEDDFFYYVQAAQNLAIHGISSFDGVHLTNGYHPLWFLILTALLKFSSGKAFFIAVQVVTLACIMAFYNAVLRVLLRLDFDLTRARGVSLLLSLHALLLFRCGMEINVSLPLGVFAVAYVLSPGFAWTPKQTFLYGLIACFTVLGRLDSIILFAMLVTFQTLSSEAPWSTRLKRIGFFCTGFFPFLVYLAINQFVFGSPMPVSAAAKQMKPIFPPSANPILGLILPFDRLKAVFVFPALFLLVCGFVLLVRRWPSLTRPHRAILSALLLFPIAHMGLLCFLSDWGVWPWYFYALVYSTLASVALLLQPRTAEAYAMPSFGIRAAILVPTFFYVLYISVYAVKKQPAYIALLSRDLAVFMREHPGTYAMGDDAGTTGFLSGQPIIQLEGLTMDKAYLANIRHQRPLAHVLHDYHADYYIVLYADSTHGCYNVQEPTNAGDLSPHMKGQICAAPLFTTTHSGKTASLFAAADVH